MGPGGPDRFVPLFARLAPAECPFDLRSVLKIVPIESGSPGGTDRRVAPCYGILRIQYRHSKWLPKADMPGT